MTLYKFISNITKLFEEILNMDASFSKPLQTTQPIRIQRQQKCCHLLEKKGTHLMRMHDNKYHMQQMQSECRISRHNKYHMQ